jgi:Spherulation-specific family 4
VHIRATPSRTAPRTMGIPAYFYPWPGDPSWAALSSAPASTIVIINPDNGPGAAPDPNYLAALQAFAGSSPVLYGYVDSGYATRDTETLVAEAETHRSFHRVEGIFIDQVTATPDQRDHYADLSERLRSRGFRIAFNPGQPLIDRSYLDLADELLVFEGSLSTYRQQAFPRWMLRCRADQLWHCVYEVDDADQYAEVVRLAAEHNAGIVFATDGRMPNPWDRLPPYWRR